MAKMPSPRNKSRHSTSGCPKTAAVECYASIACAAAAEGDPPKRPTISIDAYRGGALRLNGFGLPTILDCAGLRADPDTLINLDHDDVQIVGQAPSVEIGKNTIKAEATVTGDLENPDDPAHKVVLHARNGFKWKCSVGVQIDNLEYVATQQTAKANGKSFDGPCYIIRKGRIGHIALLGAGAEEKSSAKVAASAAKENLIMEEFDKWLAECGIDKAILTADQVASLQAKFDTAAKASIKNPGDEDGDGDDAGDDPPVKQSKEAKASESVVKSIRVASAKELKRVAAVTRVCNDAKASADLVARAVEDGWDTERTELECLRAGRPKGPPPGRPENSKHDALILEAAIRLGSEESQSVIEKDKSYTPQILEAAYKRRGMGIRDLFASVCKMEGTRVPEFFDSPTEWANAAWSGGALTNILSNVANKVLQEAFQRVEKTVPTICRKLTAKDFKTNTGVRFGGKNSMQPIPETGEIKYAVLGESSFTYKIASIGGIIRLTFRDFKNDDLGALTQAPMKLGDDAALKLESDLWTMIIAAIASGTFFSAGNGNYISGAATNLGPAGLDSAKQKFITIKDKFGQPVLAKPTILAVPPALSAEADRIYNAASFAVVGVGNSKALVANDNNYKGRYLPVTSPYFDGSEPGWLLLGDPSRLACFGVAYLDGVENPVVETVAASADTLGQAIRGYMHYGFCTIDPQGGVYSKGQA